MKKEYEKFNTVNYKDAFARQIGDIHKLCKSVLKSEISDGDRIMDLGGGPGIGAHLIDELGIKAKIFNMEPSESVHDIPKLVNVEYSFQKITHKPVPTVISL